MNVHQKPSEIKENKPLRLWPGIVIAIFIVIARYLFPIIIPSTLVYGIFGGLIGSIAIMIWWAFFSCAPRFERWGAIILMIVAFFITTNFIDVSIATGGQGMMFTMFAVPVLSVAFVGWAIVTQHFPTKIRRWSMVATIFIACGFWTLLRIDGITGEFGLDLAWRWSETSEEKLLENLPEEPTIEPVAGLVMHDMAEWPGFRGPDRDGLFHGTHISTDWAASPPKELWRRSVGPGCSSFAISGDYVFTQEQRGEEEIVSCYALKNGEPIWMHTDNARFWDSHAGAGPRSTPTFSRGRIYTMGATGILNALDARDGTLIWTRNAVNDTNLKHSGWGYASSPLIVDNLVIVAVVGQLIAYDADTGSPRWFGPDGGDSYSSPHLLILDGIKQVVLLSAKGATSVLPEDGSVLWSYSWEGDSRIVQPAITADGNILFCQGDGNGLRCVTIKHEADQWTFEERWTSSQLKPNFNDFVIHKDYAYGYNGPLLVCIDLKNGERQWRGNRYGGQVLLLPDQDLLVILTEKGELALVNATPEKFEEIANLKSINGKTWNHPAIAGNILLVRNSQEMVGYQIK